jgi:hypothetical protein
LLILIISSAWVIFTSFVQKERLSEFSDDYILQLKTSIKDSTRSFLLPAKTITKLGSYLYELDNLSLEKPDSLSAFVQPFIDSYPQFNGYFVGTEKGEFWFWHNTYADDYAYRIQTIELNDHQTLIEQKAFLDNEQKIIKVSDTEVSKYDPRTRLWYQGAKAIRGHFWSDVYSFNSDVTQVIPGITASFPIYDEQHNVKAVWGVDIVLEELSNFLSDIGSSKASELVIFNENKKIIAYSGFNKIELSEQLLSLSDLNNNVIEKAMASYQQHSFNEFYFTESGVRYLASYSSFLFGEEQDWSLLIIVPESKLVKTMGQTFHLFALFAFLVFIIALIRFIYLLKQPLTVSFSHFMSKRK